MRRRRAGLLAWVVLAGLSSAWCLTASRQLGATFDEPFYIESGLEFWRSGNPSALLSAGTMPLAIHVQTLLLFVAESATGRAWQWPQDATAMLVIARAGNLIFWWILLAYAARLGAALGGPLAGAIAVALIAFEPNFLAHASLATTDVALAACMMAFTYHYRTGRDGSWLHRAGLPMLWLALAVLAKASALLFAPMAMMAVAGEQWIHWARGHANWRRMFRDAAAILCGGLAMAIAYCGSGGGPSFQGTLARMTSDHWLRPLVAWVGSLPLFPNGFYALWFQTDHNAGGQATFLLGHETAQFLWYYVPVVMVIKLSMPLLLLFVVALMVPGRRVAAITSAAGILLLLVATMRVQTGIRFLLPVIALLVVVSSARLAAAFSALHISRRRSSAVLASALVLWMGVNDLRTWPDALRFVNGFWGGTDEGYKVVSDSNYDWGQGLPELAEWQSWRGVPLAVWYFGTDPRFPQLERFNPRQEGFDASRLAGRDVAVGVSLLYGGYVNSGSARELVLQLRDKRPIGRTRTFLIFDRIAP